MRKDLVSIIVPVYNVEKYISNCLDSLIIQSYQNIEIIVVVDGSEDGSEKIVDEYMKRTDKIYKYNQSNSGLSAARNLGLSKAEGEFIMFVDSDDSLFENSVEVLVARQKETDSDLVCANIKRLYKTERWQNYFFNKEVIEKNVLFIPEKESKYLIEISNSVCAKLFRKKLIDDSGIRFAEGYKYEDLLFTFSLIVNCEKVYLVKDFVYAYQIHDNSIMTTSEQLDDIVSISRLLLEYYTEKGFVELYYHELWHVVIKHSLIGGSFRGIRSSLKDYSRIIGLNKELLDANNVRIRANRYYKSYDILYRIYLTFLALII